MFEFEFETFLGFFSDPPPPYLGHCPKFSCFFNYDASPKLLTRLKLKLSSSLGTTFSVGGGWWGGWLVKTGINKSYLIFKVEVEDELGKNGSPLT